jgi:serine/threonine-protein kinase
MSKRPEKRYQHAEEMALDIKRYLTRERRARRREQPLLVAEAEAVKRYGPLFWIGALVIVGGAVGLLWLRLGFR